MNSELMKMREAHQSNTTIPFDLTIHNDELFLPKSNINLLEQISTSYCINGMMGQDSLLPSINMKEIESDCYLFEQRISTPESPNQNCSSKFNQQSTKFPQLDSSMAPKIRGSLIDAAKSKAREASEAKSKVF